MNKKILLFAFFMSAFTGYTQVPSYYNDVNRTLSGQALQNELSEKITSTHITFLSYTPGVWNALKQTDLDPNDPSKVVLIYGYNDSDGNLTTDRTRGVDSNGGGTTDWNREHVYPRSLGNPNLGSTGPGSDAHHLRPADVQRNSNRGNRKFANATGNSGTTAQGHWYPGDEWKGDVARMMMYMYLRYGNRCLPINVGVGNATASDSNMLQMFLEWNVEDPVSLLELQRNPLLENIQGNRNPFIDNPAFATEIWGGPQAEDRFGDGGGDFDTIAPSMPMNLVAANTTQTSTSLQWMASTDNVGVTGYDILRNGALIGTASTPNFVVTQLMSNTTYSFSVRAKDAAGNISVSSTALMVTTENSSGGGNSSGELFFSEYVEGSSNNKALEIANYSGAAVNLSVYSIKRQTNGSGAWSAPLNLSGTVNNNDVFVAANSAASNAVKNLADLVSGSSVLTFNGNDPVGLFKNDVLVDIIGNFNGGSSNFAKDRTLRRKPSVNSPSINYETTEWDVFPQNTFDDLGNHTFDGGGDTVDTQAPSVPSNSTASNVTQTTVNLSWTASTDNIGVSGYNVYQDGSLLTTTTATNTSISGLSSGTTYAFTINAFDAAGNVSAFSSALNVTTQVPQQDTQAPSVPSNGTASNVTQTTVNLSWTASTDNIGVSGYNVYQDGSLLTTTTATNASISGLSSGTTYAFTINAFDAAGNVSALSNAISVTTQEVVLTYCNARGNNVNFEFIDFVGIGGISNTTAGNGGYADFTDQVGTVSYGTNTIVLSVGFRSSSYTENWAVWIDFNKNGSFEASEKVVVGATSNAGNLSYNFEVPSSASSGTTRMRVAMKWNGIPTPCGTFAYGEVEDYTINIGDNRGFVENLKGIVIDGVLGQEQKVFSARIGPNPTSDFIEINMGDDRPASFVIFDSRGAFLKKGKVTRERIPLQELQSGIYFIKVADDNRSFINKIIIK